MSDSELRPLPVVDPDLIEHDIFWSHARRQKLVYQHCANDHLVFYPRRHCTTCGTEDLEVLESAGEGLVYSFTITRVHPSPYFMGRAPYAVGFVDLDEGFRMLCEIRGDLDTLAIGDRVRLSWDTTQDIAVPVFDITD